jgi:hypothetical protein
MVWKDCGYLSLTKDGMKVAVIIKHFQYVLSLEESREVLEGKQAYTVIYEPPEAKGETWTPRIVVL